MYVINFVCVCVPCKHIWHVCNALVGSVDGGILLDFDLCQQ